LVADFLVADFLIADFLEADSLIDGGGKDDFDFDLVFHRHFSGGEWRADPGCGNLPAGKSPSESRSGPLQLACQCVVGRAAAGGRRYILFQIRAPATVLNALQKLFQVDPGISRQASRCTLLIDRAKIDRVKIDRAEPYIASS
jgi:hypothetical protein